MEGCFDGKLLYFGVESFIVFLGEWERGIVVFWELEGVWGGVSSGVLKSLCSGEEAREVGRRFIVGVFRIY